DFHVTGVQTCALPISALAAETVRQVLGISIDKYLLINFDVFTSLVDIIAPDGVEICVREVIDDPNYPDAGFGTIPVHFDPGCQRSEERRVGKEGSARW